MELVELTPVSRVASQAVIRTYMIVRPVYFKIFFSIRVAWVASERLSKEK